jgi:hypothetical protein
VCGVTNHPVPIIRASSVPGSRVKVLTVALLESR